MPAPSPLVKTLLRSARAAEQAIAGSGATYLATGRAVLSAAILNGGRQISSVSGGGKAYAFSGYSIESATAGLDEAESLWADLDTTELANLLDKRPIKTSQARFGTRIYGAYPFYYPGYNV